LEESSQKKRQAGMKAVTYILWFLIVGFAICGLATMSKGGEVFLILAGMCFIVVLVAGRIKDGA